MSDFDKPITSIADLNPSVFISGLPDDFLISFIGMADVSEGGRLISKHDRPLREVKFGFTRFIEGDVLFAKITPCMENGKGAFVTGLRNKIGFGSTEFHVLRNRQNGDAGFIYQILQSSDFRLKAEARMTGSAGQKRVPSDFFDFYKTFIPTSVPEQRKIARFLSTVDAVIEKSEAAIGKYKAIKAGMMHDLFTRGIDLVTGKLRPSYEEAPELYKQSELGWVPREWEVDKLEHSTDYVDYRGKTPPKSEFGIFLVTARNIKDGFIDYDISKEYIPAYAYELTMSRGKAEVGDVVITTEAPMGNIAQIDRDHIALAQRVIKYRGKSSKLHNDFLAIYLMSSRFQRLMIAESTGSTVLGIKGSRLHKLFVAMPSKNEQIAIAKIVKTQEGLIKIENLNLHKHQQLKSSLMSDLLTGRVRVKYSEEKAEKAS